MLVVIVVVCVCIVGLVVVVVVFCQTIMYYNYHNRSVPSDAVVVLVHKPCGPESFVTVVVIEVVLAVADADAVVLLVSATAESVATIDWLSDACTPITLVLLLQDQILLLLAHTCIVLL